jgi:hypothetical protein
MHVPPLEFTTADKALVELTASAVVCFVDAPGAAADETQRAVYRAAYGREAPVVNAAGEGTCAPAPFTPSLSLSRSLSLFLLACSPPPVARRGVRCLWAPDRANRGARALAVNPYYGAIFKAADALDTAIKALDSSALLDADDDEVSGTQLPPPLLRPHVPPSFARAAVGDSDSGGGQQGGEEEVVAERGALLQRLAGEARAEMAEATAAWGLEVRGIPMIK